MKDKVEIVNEGKFIPATIDTLIINDDYIPPYYRNTYLAQAMVNLNLIDTAGMGIKRSFEKLRARYFPMLDYDFSEANRVRVTKFEFMEKLLMKNIQVYYLKIMI